MQTLICIPTYNEKDNVGPISQAIFAALPRDAEILFIDDGSPDGTGQVIEEMRKSEPRIHVLHRKGKLGLATAYIQGFQWGMAQKDTQKNNQKKYDIIFEMDADFSHDARHLPEFLAHFKNPAIDAVCGSRYMPGGGVVNWNHFRQLISHFGSIYSRMWLGYQGTDWTGGFNAWRSSLLENIHLDSIQSRGYTFQIEMKYRALELGKNVVETPIVFQERRAGASKMSGSIVKEAILGVALLKWKSQSGRLF